MSNVIYINDFRPGIHRYTHETGQRRPSCPLQLWIGHYGGHFIDSRFELKGRGIKLMESDERGFTYRVTDRALAKLEEQFPISYEMVLD